MIVWSFNPDLYVMFYTDGLMLHIQISKMRNEMASWSSPGLIKSKLHIVHIIIILVQKKFLLIASVFYRFFLDACYLWHDGWRYNQRNISIPISPQVDWKYMQKPLNYYYLFSDNLFWNLKTKFIDISSLIQSVNLIWHTTICVQAVAEEKFKVCSAAYQSLCDKLALNWYSQ